VETFQTVEVSEKMGSCLYESGEKTYNRVHKATGAYIRAFATPKGYLVSVNGPQEAVEKAVQMLRMALVRTIFPGHAREIFGDKKESVVSISQHTGSVIAYWRIGMPPNESVVVALCPSSVSRKMVSDILDHPPMKMGLSKLVVYWLRTKGPDGVRIDHILHQTGAYVRIEDAVRPWTSDHCHEALVLGSRKATEATKNLIKECDTVKKIEVSETFASYFKVIGEPWRLAILTNALVFIEPSESSAMRNIVIVGPAAGVALAAEQILRHGVKRVYDAISRSKPLMMGQREAHHSAATMRDLTTDRDFYLCRVDDHTRHASVPPPPLPGERSSMTVTDFRRHVPLPFAVESERERWAVTKQVLTAIADSQRAPEPLTADQLIDSISAYTGERPQMFSVLRDLFHREMQPDRARKFLHQTVPRMAELALAIEHLITQPIPLLTSGSNTSLTLSQQQAASILANAFFCTFPEHLRDGKDERYNTINFSRIFCRTLNPRGVEKLKCLLHYFRRVTDRMPPGTVTFLRQAVDTPPKWQELDKPLGSLRATPIGTIEDDGAGMSQMDFANEYIGGGVLGSGCVQEEIRFLICPEMIVSCLVCEKMEPNEAIFIIGAERYSDYEGYGRTFKWKNRTRDGREPRDAFGHVYSELIAVDALLYSSRGTQFRGDYIRRELLKASAGFSVRTPLSSQQIATGNWGCGAFRGDLELKGLIQLMAATAADRSLGYFTFNDNMWSERLNDMVALLHEKNVTVATLYSTLLEFSCVHSAPFPSLFDYLQKRLGEERPPREATVDEGIEDERAPAVDKKTPAVLDEKKATLEHPPAAERPVKQRQMKMTDFMTPRKEAELAELKNPQRLRKDVSNNGDALNGKQNTE
ncbi:hypothetical protein AAVH_10874, partial [Aphelenchoides avenae]